jgi:hypothetical protein
MLKIELTVREALSVLSQVDSHGELYEKIVLALEIATGTEKADAKTSSFESFRVKHSGIQQGLTAQQWASRIQAIQAFRLFSGWGLKDSKDWIENPMYGGDPSYSPVSDLKRAKILADKLNFLGCVCEVVEVLF